MDNLKNVINAVKGELPAIEMKRPLEKIIEEEFSGTGTVIEGTVVTDNMQRSKSMQ